MNELERITPNEFKAELIRKGWSFVELGVRWNMTANWLSKVAARSNRPRYWDDAIRGLPQRATQTNDDGALTRMTPLEFRLEVEKKRWTYVELGERWCMTANWLAKVAARADRPRYWDDVVRGLPDRLSNYQTVTNMNPSIVATAGNT